MHHEFIKRSVAVAVLPEKFNDEAIDAAIIEAVRMLSNLIHYTCGRSHYDEDIAYVARVLLCANSQ